MERIMRIRVTWNPQDLEEFREDGFTDQDLMDHAQGWITKRLTPALHDREPFRVAFVEWETLQSPLSGFQERDTAGV